MKFFSYLLKTFIAVSIIAIEITNLSCTKTKRTFSIAYMEIWADSLKQVLMNTCKEWAQQEGVTLVSEQGEEWKLSEVDIKAGNYIEGKTNLDLVMLPNHLAVVYQNELRDFSTDMDEIEKNYPGIQEISKAMLFDKGRWSGVPAFSWSHLMVLRKDILDSIGESIPLNYDDLRRVTIKLNNQKNDFVGFGLGLGKDDDFAMFFQSLLWSFGGTIFDETGKNIIFDKTYTREAVTYIMDLYQSGVFPKGALQWDGAANNRAFLGKKTGLTFNSPTIYYVAQRKDPELAKKIVHALYPIGPGGVRHQYATGFCFVSRANNENRDLVDSFLQFLYKKENYSKLITAGGGSVNPAFKGLESLPIWNDPNLRIGLESMKYEHPVGWPGPVTKTAAYIFQLRIATKMFSNIIEQGVSIDEAIRQAEAEMYQNKTQ